MDFDLSEYKNKILLLDGAMGTMLQASGLKVGLSPELISLSQPELLSSIHKKYIDAGSKVIYTNTFGANSIKAKELGSTVDEMIGTAVKAAKAAAQGTGAAVALDIGPLGELIEPMGSLSFEQAYDIFKEMVLAGKKHGVDLAVIETMTDLYEAKAALLAVKENSDFRVFVTMSFDESGRTFTGCTIPSMAHTLESLGADAIGLNCSMGPEHMAPLIKELCAHTSLPVIAKPNAGLPDPVDGHYNVNPYDFSKSVADCIAAGAAIVGGCCGTTPEHIAALNNMAASLKPTLRQIEPVSFVCSPVTPCPINGIRVIGERINPTGKKRFQQALIENDLDYILGVAIAQEDCGANILDVNVGHPGVDEVKLLPAVIKKLQSAISLPLQLDSSNPDALAAGLRVYNGKAVVNSVNGDEETLSRILPIVKKYGAAVVGLTLDKNGVPKSCDERFAIAKRILDAALSYGIKKEDVFIDCLTLTVSAEQDQAKETLAALRRVKDELGLNAVLGISNISFGLPNRTLLGCNFLVQAMGAGLTLPIINPNQKEMMDAIAAFKVLSGEDSQSRDYIARFAEVDIPLQPTGRGLTLNDAVMRGLKSEAAALAKAALATEDELSIVEKHLIPALDKVGTSYEKGRLFLPQLLAAAQAAQAVFEVLKTNMAANGSAPIKKGLLAVATVKGDIHDIGKNIVKTVLENYGYGVIDLGRDVPPNDIVDAVISNDIRLVGLSALMTTTLPAMEQTTKLLKALPNPPTVFVGGAVVTPEYAADIGADHYAKDAQDSVKIAKEVLK